MEIFKSNDDPPKSSFKHVPRHISGWMQANLDRIGDKRLNDFVWLPSSYDSGMYALTRRSDRLAREASVLTQSKSVGDQLRLGVRRFDIRPMYDPDSSNWYAAHGGVPLELIGWVVGIGPSLNEVIADINGFTKDHAELIVLNVTHIKHISNGDEIKIHHRHLLPSLFNQLFTAIDNVYLGQSDVQSMTLRELIGGGESKVIISVNDEEINLQDMGDVPGRLTKFDAQCAHSITRVPSDFTEEFHPHREDIREKAKVKQNSERRHAPRKMWESRASGGCCSVFDLENVFDMAPMTICLAATVARIIAARPPIEPDVVIVYNGKLIDDPKIKAKVAQLAKNQRELIISGNSFGQNIDDAKERVQEQQEWPLPACALYVFGKGDEHSWARFGYEGTRISFDTRWIEPGARVSDHVDGIIDPPPSRPPIPPPDHFYTTDARYEGCEDLGYQFEGVVGYVYQDASRPNCVPLYRFSSWQGDHLYTEKQDEMRNLSAQPGWKFEKISCYVLNAPTQDATPFYRARLNDRNCEHFYYTDIAEKVPYYTQEGQVGYIFKSQVDGTVPLYRLFAGAR